METNNEKPIRVLCVMPTLDRGGAETMSSLKQILPADLLNNYEEIEFEGENFLISKRWHDMLTVKYHDYMKMPPEEDRKWKHLPLLIDFDKNYDEIY